MLGYVLWHRPAAAVEPSLYEEALGVFHRKLADYAPAGFRGSAAFAFRAAPWFPADPGYVDWYKVDDFTSLGALNDAAVTGARKDSHDKVAAQAGDGVAGLYRLAAGSSDFAPVAVGTWFRKPAGMTYNAFFEQASKWIDPATMGLWLRQMTFGPGSEYCVLSPHRIELPELYEPVTIELRTTV